MAILTIVLLPDPKLKAPTRPIEVFDESIRTLVHDMYETMYHAKGVGLAAPQVGISLQLAVLDVSEQRDQPFCIINPQIIRSEGSELMHAGCLSIPGVYDHVPRSSRVTVRAQDVTGAYFEIEGEGLLGHCLQHEIDHLNGKVFIDYLSSLKKNRALKKMNKFIR